MLLHRSCILFLPPITSTVYFFEAASNRPLKKFKPVSEGLYPPNRKEGDSIDEVVLKLKFLAKGFN